MALSDYWLLKVGGKLKAILIGVNKVAYLHVVSLNWTEVGVTRSVEINVLPQPT